MFLKWGDKMSWAQANTPIRMRRVPSSGIKGPIYLGPWPKLPSGSCPCGNCTRLHWEAYLSYCDDVNEGIWDESKDKIVWWGY
tara:strand:- start:149 stop:397 length:249 start_codon:yes stop_codon:yes gene_type:complete